MNAVAAEALLLTPFGQGGIAVILLRGPGTRRIVEQCFRPAGRPASTPNAKSQSIVLGNIVEADGSPIDQVTVATDVAGQWAEINCHAGTRVVQRIVGRLGELGATRADTAEAAWPEVEGIEAEAMQAMPRAATRFVVAWLSSQATALPTTLAEIVQMIDRGRIEEARRTLADLAATWPAARRMLEPARVVLVGPANAGKSTLANALSGREGSIVADMPGTTRDWVEHAASLDGVPVTLVDTAGVREAADALEAAAIVRTHGQRSAADLILAVIDGTRDPGTQIESLGPIVPLERAVIAISKCDLARPIMPPGLAPLHVSAAKRIGLDELSMRIRAALGVDGLAPGRPAIFTARQAVTVKQALELIRQANFSAARNLLAAELCRSDLIPEFTCPSA